MRHIIIVNGYPQSGKDTFVSIACKILNRQGINSYAYSSVEEVKKAAKLLGWNGVKTPTNRNALSELKDLSSLYWDGPFRSMEKQLNFVTEGVIFFFIREPEEIERMVKCYPETITVFIKRAEHEEATNHADQELENYIYDFYIFNNGSLERLEESINTFLEYNEII